MKRSLKLAAVAATLALGLTACGSGGGDAEAELGTPENPVRIGTVSAGEPYWETFKSAVEAEGISVELVNFTDYSQPNPALSEGEIHLNQFQHIIFLAQYNEASGEDLQAVGSTATYPLALYSNEFDSPEAIPDGETVIVPNDETNQARALLVLQSVGLIELADGGSPYSTLNDIEDSSRVKVEAVDAALTASSLVDVAAAIINNDFVTDAGLTAEDAIAQDDPSDPSTQPYVNIWATSADQVENPVFAQIIEIYHGNQAVIDGVLESSGNTAEIVDLPAADLNTTLADVQTAYTEAQ
ncbi:MAG: MetQ/NlpA family ABC transporter substrate-binding protein [Agrococcus casei]|uniref:MetQ/NlpA family ABC transporter substrate-binding protein n=1 Tax=Agrococcus casei TaxID=343512 RepID=UPI003F929CD9